MLQIYCDGPYVLASVALLGIGGWLVVIRQLTLGQLVAAELIVSVSMASIVKLGKSLEDFDDLMASVHKLGVLIDLPLERTTGAVALPVEAPAALNLKGVGYTYAGARTPVIENLNLQLSPGDRAALLGPSSAGKSTITDLIYGLREPQHGHVELDGIDLRDIRLDDLRRHVAAVTSELEVFAASVLDNIRLDRPWVSTMDVRAALAAVDMLEPVLALPNGLLTQLTTGGSPLSRGQAVRLALARAIAGRPRLLILDEVLDGFPPYIRERILPTFLDRKAPWTLLLITVEFGMAQSCDRQLQFSELMVAKPVPDGPGENGITST
ncbi:MAG: ABC transporter ATP-binding protein [Planctomycetes bacterium]|nr:ABC transporter ATP-binding protein [Planctomycetota bacterium]